ncbi:MAG: DUF2332 domain-containing protein [Pikeienuella sp.]
MKPEVRAHFRAQGVACRRLGSRFMAKLLPRLAAAPIGNTRFGARIADWPGEPEADALALRAAGALHGLALSGRAPAFAALYPSAEGSDEAMLAAVIAAHDDWLSPWLDSPPQTNEAARSGALLGGLLSIAAATGMEIELLEIGASAGLNLIPDLYRYDLGGRRWGEADAAPGIDCAWRNGAPPLDAPLKIAARAGVDLRPVDPARRPSPLLAYIWPDQPARLARARAALERLAKTDIRVETGDAAEWLAARLAAEQPAGRVRVVMHSIMWLYLPERTRAAIDDAIAQAGARADASHPLARLSMEGDGVKGSAALTVTLWPGGVPRLLARACYHGSWVDWVGKG